MSTEIPQPHIGRNIVRIRQLRGMKQYALAKALGEEQQTVSRWEQNEKLDDKKLAAVAEVLGVTPETIKNFNEEATLNIIQNNYDNAQHNVNYQVNPIEVVKQAYEELLKSERERIVLLEKLLKKYESE